MAECTEGATAAMEVMAASLREVQGETPAVATSDWVGAGEYTALLPAQKATTAARKAAGKVQTGELRQ